MKRAAIFSYHLYQQHRKGGMHWICNSLHKSGVHVNFITCDYSYLSKIKGDRRTQYGTVLGVNRLQHVVDGISAGVLMTPWHPIGRAHPLLWRLADLVTSSYPLFVQSQLKQFVKDVDLIIIESCGALMLVDSIRKITDAPIVYRVSDNLRVVRPVPSLLAAESRAIDEVDAVSLASEHLARLLGQKNNFQIDAMGLDKVQFDNVTYNPYQNDGRVKVIISGSSGMDVETLMAAIESFPQWDFIQFGSAEGLPNRSNLKLMGEQPFRELVPWVKNADIGFAPYLARSGFEYQAEHSNRLLQYTYSGIPSVVPQALVSPTKPHFLGYTPGDMQSVRSAFESAKSFDRSLVPVGSVLDWDQLAARLSKVVKRQS